MIAMNNEQFESGEFAIQVMARGSFVDTACGKNNFVIEATTIRLNHIALNEWNGSQNHNCRECYEDGPDGDLEWEAHKKERTERFDSWTRKIKNDLGISPDDKGITITQAQAEVFSVVHIWKVTK